MRGFFFCTFIFVAFFLFGKITVTAADGDTGQYCEPTRHLCQCAPDGVINLPGTKTVPKCCLNIMPGTSAGICTGSTDPLRPIPDSVKDPTCVPGCDSDVYGNCYKILNSIGSVSFQLDRTQPCGAKNYCASDGSYEYTFNPATGTCESAGKTPIFLCLANQSCETALGTITTDPTSFVQAILKFVVGVSGGIALLMLIIAGYNIMTSAGDPQKLAAGREMLVSVISGVVLIVFSMVLLKAIGVDILALPGFNP